MQLGNLVSETELPKSVSQLKIKGITADSRKVKPGYLFVALNGSNCDGRKFIHEAIELGATAVVVDTSSKYNHLTIPVVSVENPRRSLALMSANFFQIQPDTCIAVTGTSGKTSVSHFLYQIFTFAGHSAASLGTIGLISSKLNYSIPLTTPDSVKLHNTLAKLATNGITHVAFEASSHGLDQHRLDGVRLKAGCFTNFSRDHLDYHSSLESYFAAKLRLFDTLLPIGSIAVFDPTEPYSDKIKNVCDKRKIKQFTVGKSGKDIRLESATIDGFGQILDLCIQGMKHQVKLSLLGDFQVSNALFAAGLAISVGIEPKTVIEALADLKNVPARLDLVGKTCNNALIFIDYAHKPNALKKVLGALRPFTNGKLVCVFGAGGDRDSGKRAMMGEIAVQHADSVIVTDDNPRTENAEEIRKAILRGAVGAIEIADRTEAVRTGISLLETGDILCIAGKGHEKGQIIGNRVIPYSDYDTVNCVLSGGT